MSHPTTNMAMKRFSILFIIYSYLYYDPETRHYLINNFISGVYRKCKPEDALKIIRKDIQAARLPGFVLQVIASLAWGTGLTAKLS